MESSRRLLCTAAAALLGGCAPPLQHYTADVPALVNGTPIAEGLEDLYERTAGLLPYANCPVVDHGEVKSLTPAVRMGWLASHPLLADIAWFSVVAMPSPERVSAVLRPLHALLSKVDPRNDSQVIYYDAIIPGSTLLGFANADHWAIALPFESQAPVLAASLVDQNRFPRPQLLEAAVRIAEERLAAGRGAQKRIALMEDLARYARALDRCLMWHTARCP